MQCKTCYIDTDSLIINIKTRDVYKDVANDVKNRFDTLSCEMNRPLQKRKYNIVIGLTKDELGGKIMPEFVGPRPKTYFYLIDDDSEDKKVKRTEKCVIKRILKSEDYKKCLLNIETISKSQQRFKREVHNVNKLTKFR